jgi:MATE family multidrug resistance protein
LQESRATLALALPLILANLAQVAIWTTDVIMIGWLGPQPLAAVALAFNFQYALLMLGIGVMTAVGPLVAQARGARQSRGVRRSVRQGLWAGALLAAIYTVIFLNGEAIILALGQVPENAADAGLFMRCNVAGMAPILWTVALRMFVASFDRARVVTLVTCLGVLVNALGNYGLIFGNFGLPAWGLAGAGIVSAGTNWLIFLLLLGYVVFKRPFRRYTILIRLWRPDWPRFREVFKLGLPIGATMGMETVLFATAAFLMGLIGTSALAAHTIVLQCAAISFMVPLGVGQAATIRVGINAGAGNPSAAYRAGWVALELGCGFMAMMSLVFLLFPRSLIALYLEEGDPASLEVMALGAQFFMIAALFQVVDGAQAIAAGALRGLKDTQRPMVIAGVSYWLVGLSASLALGFGLGLQGLGIWIGLALGLAAAASLLVQRFHALRGQTL